MGHNCTDYTFTRAVVISFDFCLHSKYILVLSSLFVSLSPLSVPLFSHSSVPSPSHHTHSLSLSRCVRPRARVCMCMCVYLCVWMVVTPSTDLVYLCVWMVVTPSTDLDAVSRKESQAQKHPLSTRHWHHRAHGDRFAGSKGELERTAQEAARHFHARTKVRVA